MEEKYINQAKVLTGMRKMTKDKTSKMATGQCVVVSLDASDQLLKIPTACCGRHDVSGPESDECMRPSSFRSDDGTPS